MSSEYYTVLTAVQNAVEGIGALGGAPVKLRPDVAVLRDNQGGGDPIPLVVVAPDRRTWEKIESLHFEGAMTVGYPVLVAAVAANAFDQTVLQWVLAVRQAVRDTLFTTALGGATNQFDVDYDPAPRGVDLSGVSPELFPSLQRFTFILNSQRPNP